MSYFNYFAKGLLIGTVCLSFAACSSDSDDDNGDPLRDGNHRIVLQSVDIANAKCLSLGYGASSENATRGDGGNMLFKVDENGNVSAVKLTYVVVDEITGETAEVRTDIKVTPSMITSIEGKYTVLYMCDFLDDKGNSYIHEILQSYEPDGYEVDLLVRNADGKIFYIPNRIYYDFFNEVVSGSEDGMTETDVNGNVYIAGRNSEYKGVIGKISIVGEQLVVQQITPGSISAIDQNLVMLPLANGTVIVKRPYGNESHTLYYSNGAFETIKTYILSEDGFLSNTILFLSKNGSAIGVEWTGMRDFTDFDGEPTLSLYKYNIGTAYGTCRRGDFIASCPVSRYYLEASSLIETDENYIVDMFYAVNKNTKEMIQIKAYEDYLAYLDADYPGVYVANKNKYHNRYWGVNEKGSVWFDPETLEFGAVDFNNNAERFCVTQRVCDIPNGVYYIYGVDYTDGGNVICAVDIETGRTSVTHSPDNREVVALAPLN